MGGMGGGELASGDGRKLLGMYDGLFGGTR